MQPTLGAIQSVFREWHPSTSLFGSSEESNVPPTEARNPNIHIATVSEGGIWNRLVGNAPFWAARGPPLESRRSCNNRASVKEDELRESQLIGTSWDRFRCSDGTR